MGLKGFFTEETKNEIFIRWNRIIGVFVFLIIIFVALSQSFVIVQAGHIGVLLRWGQVQPVIFNSGFHFIIPLSDSVVPVSVQTQKYEANGTAETKDLLAVSTSVAVNYHVNPDLVNKLYQDVGLGYQDKVIAPVVQEIVQANTAKFDASDLITNREIVKSDVEQGLKDRLLSYNIVVESISITDFTFPAEFTDAITAKQTAVQLALKAQNDLQRIQIEANQTVAQAQGQAQSIQIIDQQLNASPKYLQYLAIQKWNGILPLTYVQGNSQGTLLNIPIQTSSTQ